MAARGLPPAIFLMGPTASGKTALAFELCDHLPAEIISVDSALVYRGMDIGTAKPSPEELARYPHHLVDIRDPAEPYSAAEFRRDALAAMAEITAAGRIPLLVGGTMLYFRALLEGLIELPPIDPAIRRDIEREAGQRGWPDLHRELAAADPQTAAALHPNHSARIARALEVWRATGTPISLWRARQGTAELPWRVLQLAVAPPDRKTLHTRIEERLSAMFEAGLVEEVRTLFERGDLHRELPAIRAVGYSQVWDYLAGDVSEAEMRERALAATRQLAKRQLTWLRKWPDLHWVVWPPDDEAALKALFGLIADADFPVHGL